MKKALALLLVLVMVFALVACGEAKTDDKKDTETKTDDTGKKEDKKEEKKEDGGFKVTIDGKEFTTSVDPSTITIACSVYQQDAHQSLIREGARQACKELGVNFLDTCVDSDVAKELEFLSTCMSQNVNGYVWAPCGTASLAPLADAQKAGAHVCICNGTQATEANPEPWAPFDGNFYNSNKDMCKALSEYIKPDLEKIFADEIKSGEKIEVGVIAFDALSAEGSNDRANAILNMLDELKINYEIVGRQDAVEQDKAIEVSTDMLTANPNMDLFVSCCESASIGATMTVANQGLEGKCYVAGIDTSVQIAKLMQEYPEIGICYVGQSSFAGGYNACIQAISLCLGVNEEFTATQKGRENIQPNMILDVADPAGIQAYLDEMAALGVTG